MSIVKMKRLRLIGLRSDREELLRQLQDLGCVQIDAVPSDADPSAWEGLLSPDSAPLEEARARGAQAREALAVLGRAAPEKKGLLDPLPTVTRARLFDDGARASAEAQAQQVCELERQRAEAQAQIGKLRARRKALEPWLCLDVPLETASTAAVTALFGALPAKTDLAALEQSLGEAGELCQLMPAGADRDARYVFFLCHKSVEGQALAALQAAGFSRTAFRDLTGTAAENDAALAREIAQIEEQVRDLTEQLAAQAQSRRDLELLADRWEQARRLEEAKSRLLDTEETFLLTGWFPAEAEEQVRELLEAHPCAWESADPTPQETETAQVPVKLKNGRLSRCMNTITEMYSLPAYDGIDPNPYMFPFFVVFFGMMMADMAYGIIMIAASVVYLRAKRPPKPYFMEGVLWCGISTLIWGALTGGFLGDFIPQLLRVIDPASTFEMPALFTPLNDTIPILIGSLVLGVIQVFTGMTISVVKKVKDGQFIDALFDEITWWIILAGVAVTVLGQGIGKYVLIAGFLMLAVGGTRSAKGFGKVTSLVGLVYNGVSGFFSDILSYLRLMALMLAGSVIAQVFNTLGAVFGNVIVFVIISLIGNALNLALNLLGCYVHDLRLQCLEFFNRFYKEGGRPFQPLDIDTTYVTIQKDPT